MCCALNGTVLIASNHQFSVYAVWLMHGLEKSGVHLERKEVFLYYFDKMRCTP